MKKSMSIFILFACILSIVACGSSEVESNTIANETAYEDLYVKEEKVTQPGTLTTYTYEGYDFSISDRWEADQTDNTVYSFYLEDFLS